MRASLATLLLLLFLVATGCTRTRYVPVATSASSAPASVVLINRTQTPVYYVYVSSCSSNSWGPDRLGDSEVVSPGTQRSFAMTAGCWDLKAEFRDGREASERNVRLNAGSSWTWTLTGR